MNLNKLRYNIAAGVFMIGVVWGISYLIFDGLEKEYKIAVNKERMTECNRAFTYEYCKRKIYGAENEINR